MTSALHREAAEFMRSDYEMTLAMLRRRRCPVDGEPLTYPEADQPEGDHPPIFECPTGHGYWSTDGAQCGWYRDLRDDGREPWQQYGPVRVPGFPVGPRPLAVGDVLDDGSDRPGYCRGAFGYSGGSPTGAKRVEAFGRDWVVARGLDDGVVYTAKVVPESLVTYRRRPR